MSAKTHPSNCLVRAPLCFIAILCLAASLCAAQHYTFSRPAAGMDNLNVDCIAQDNAGFLWIGTENGLYRYDGSQFRKYGPADGLNARTVQSVFSASDGTLLVGTTAGIYFQLSNGSFDEILPPNPSSRFSQRIGSVFTAIAPGQVVAADRSGAFLLRRSTPDKWTAEPMNFGQLQVQDSPIWSVLAGPGGALWFGCGSDLCLFDHGKTIHWGAALHLPPEQWLHLLLSRDGHLWIRGASHLGEVMPRDTRAPSGQALVPGPALQYQARDLPGRAIAEPYDALVLDAQGQVAASQGPAFGLWEKGKWRMVTARNGLTDFDISALFADREGSLWIAALGHGLQRWVGQDQWEALTTTEGLTDGIVWASLRDQNGGFWIGTESGLDWVPAGSSVVKPWTDAGIETPRAMSLAESPDGTVWLGSAAGKLVRIGELSHAGHAWKTPEIYRILCDSDRRLWLATAAGLYVVETESVDQVPLLVEDPSFDNPRARFSDLTMDAHNHVWAASDLGLFRLDGNRWHHINTSDVGVNPTQIAADPQGNLWAAGNFPGVVRMNVAGDRVVESATITRPRLLSEQVGSRFADSRGWHWVGQDAGLTVYDGNTWRSFTQDDGLIWNDLDSNGISEDADGSLWIGTSGGLSHLIRPETVPVITPQAPAIPEIAYGATAITSGARIPWNAGSLAISMAVLSFRDAHHVHIRYRLLGLDSDWVESSDENFRYPRLEPGNYRFQAETVDVTGGAVSPVKEIDFRIAPRWWQSGELRIMLALLSGILVALLWRFRVNRLVSQKSLLERAVQHRTNDLQREKSELLRARELMRHHAEHDDLTGLWNHRIIIERLRGEVARARREGLPISLILVDLDHFKGINDTFGHPCGDLALKEIGAVLLRSVRTYDWVGRYGGEEFLLILPGSNLVSARLRAEHLRQAVEFAHISSGKGAIKVTASFGVVSGFPADYESLLHTADKALYRAKDLGRNCVVALDLDSPQNPPTPRSSVMSS